MPTPDRVVSIHPYWQVAEGKLDEFKSLCHAFLAVAEKEQRTVYYSFTFNGNEVFCREAYDSADAALEHLSNVGQIMQRAMSIAAIPRLEIHGPEEELAKLRGPAAAFQPVYYTLRYGIRR